MVWREINATPRSLGGSGSATIRGYACPNCTTAIDDAGAVGPTARGRAVVAHLRQASEKKAERLRSLLTDDFPPALPAWGATKERPSAEPWTHLRRVIERL